MPVMLVLAQLDILIIKTIKQARMVRAKFMRESYSFTVGFASYMATLESNHSGQKFAWVKNGTGHSTTCRVLRDHLYL